MKRSPRHSEGQQGGPSAIIPLVWLLMLALVMGGAGCAAIPAPHAATMIDKIVWPPPPMAPRIVWVQTIATGNDVGIHKGFWGRLWGTVFGEEAIRITRPYGLHVDGKRRIFIADTGGQAIHVIDRVSGRYELVRGDEANRFLSPIGVAEDMREIIYVSDSAAGKIYRFNLDDFKIEAFISKGLQRPTGIVYNPHNDLLYVSDTLAGQVVAFTTQGREAFRFGMPGENPGQFNRPTDLALDEGGRLFVTDALNGRVQIFSANGAYLKGFGKQGDASGLFAKPKGIGIDSEGHMHICDALFDTVQIFDEDGQFLLSYGNRGSGKGELWMPSGLFIDHNDFIYVADTYNNRLQVFRYIREVKED
ncbi:6-bladed beta-propeller [Oryzomonas rubra]|nr:6-bladed beta-propeller [Oryzomonas rubra]